MSETRIVVERLPAPPRPNPGEFLCGAAEVDITPHLDLPLAGFSTEGMRGHGTFGRSIARALYLRDERGEELVLCVMDLMSASRLLHELISERALKGCGIGVDRLVLTGTHIHTGPAGFYGNSLYDSFAAVEPGFDRALCEWLAARVASAIVSAKRDAVPGGVGIAESRCFGLTRNRSLAAFQNNVHWQQWTGPGFPGEGAPDALTPEQRCVDPRVTALVAAKLPERVPIAVFGFLRGHATALGPNAPFYSPDWPGIAARLVRWRMESGFGAADVVVAVAPSAGGDVNVWRYGLSPKIDPGIELVRWVGERAGEALAETARAALAVAAPRAIEVRFGEPSIFDPAPPANEDVRLSNRALFGGPTIGGSEESRTPFHKLGLVKEGSPGIEFPDGDPQHPKARAGFLVQDLLMELANLRPQTVHPLHVARIGDHLFATVPGEPTIWAGFEIERELRLAKGAANATVIAYAGDYGGYFASRKEYYAQHYEGSSTLYGRNSAAYVRARLLQLASAAPVPAPIGKIVFDTVRDAKRFKASDRVTKKMDPEPRAERLPDGTAEVRWRMPSRSRILFATAPWIVVEAESAGGAWAPLSHMGRELNDRWHPFLIQRFDREDFADTIASILGIDDDETWVAKVDLPPSTPASKRIRFRVGARDQFPGFVAEAK